MKAELFEVKDGPYVAVYLKLTYNLPKKVQVIGNNYVFNEDVFFIRKEVSKDAKHS